MASAQQSSYLVAPGVTDQVTALLSRYRSREQELEIEFRYTTGQVGSTGIDQRAYQRFRTWMLARGAVDVDSTDLIYTNVPGRFNQAGQYTRKESLLTLDNRSFGIRTAVSREVVETRAQPSGPPSLTRRKHRLSLQSTHKGQAYRIDLTRVESMGSQTGTQAGTQYELEVELLHPIVQPVLDTTLTGVLSMVFKTLHGTHVEYSAEHRAAVVGSFNRAMGSQQPPTSTVLDHSVMDMARNLKLRDLTQGNMIPSPEPTPTVPTIPSVTQGIRRLTTGTTGTTGTSRASVPEGPRSSVPEGPRYAVSIKADGRKRYLYMHETGVYLLYAPSEIDRLTSAYDPNLRGTIVQGELLPGSVLLVYDILAWAGQSLLSQPMPERVRHLDSVLGWRLPGVNLRVKTFHPFETADQFYALTNRLLTEAVDYPTDGLIFSPWNQPYSTAVQSVPLHQRQLGLHPESTKWKPPVLLTLDLTVTRRVNGIYLMANQPRRGLVPFLGTEEHRFNSRSQLDLAQFADVPSETILEFQWSPERQMLVAIQNRSEKPSPNNIDIALDVWDDLHQPITEALIRGLAIGLMPRYHNRIKRDLYQTLTKPTSLISIGAGRGGDLRKWAQAGFQYCLAVEPDTQNLAELFRRYRDNLTGSMQVATIQTTGTDLDAIMARLQETYRQSRVEVLESMLSLSFLFDSDQSLRALARLSQVATRSLLIFTIDGQRVLEYFQAQGRELEPGVYQAPLHQVEARLHHPDLNNAVLTAETEPNPQVQLEFNIEGTIVRNYREYLVNLPRLDYWLAKAGWTLQSTQPATQEAFLNTEEQIVTSWYVGRVYGRG